MKLDLFVITLIILMGMIIFKTTPIVEGKDPVIYIIDRLAWTIFTSLITGYVIVKLIKKR